MRERPMLFSGPMVRALLTCTKSQTRRAVKLNDAGRVVGAGKNWHPDDPNAVSACPYGQPGDRLWVRETWQHANFPLGPYQPGTPVFYRADYMNDPHGPDGERSPEGKYRTWRPSIHMPRTAARIVLEITHVRVERLQDISDSDCWAEGIPECDGLLNEAEICRLAKAMGRSFEDPQPTYAALWESLNGPGSWDANPWVWVVEFKKITI